MQEKTLRIEREFRSSPERVFAAFQQAEAFQRWWCPPGYEVEEVKVQFEIGGSYEIHPRASAGAPTMTVSGRYLEISPPHRLKFTHGFGETAGEWLPELSGVECVVTVELVGDANRTRLTLVEESIPSTSVAQILAGGWPVIPGRLAELTEASRQTSAP